ncbi:MAG: hypothetical protein M1837_007250 [Sclerophora amabilis]|nr:MAG: hypothetical protein M1837_007250 [Sclerophora amabilis]
MGRREAVKYAKGDLDVPRLLLPPDPEKLAGADLSTKGRSQSRLVNQAKLKDREMTASYLEAFVRPGYLDAMKQTAERKRREDIMFRRSPGRRKELTVVILQNASKWLNESDFRRLVPRGKHIEDWRHEGDILQVIPGRDPVTLQRKGFYFIVFASSSSSRAFQENANRLHQLCRMSDLRLSSMPILPPLDYLTKGEDASALLQSYTLMPRAQSQQLVLKPLVSPFAISIQQIVDAGGYPRMIHPRSNKPLVETAVLFSVTGGLWNPSLHAIQHVLDVDGTRHRGKAWGIRDNGKDFTVVEGPTAAHSREGRQPLQTETGKENGSPEDFGMFGTRIQKPSAGQTAPPKWIINFEDSVEARRFVRAWHKRPFPVKQGEEKTTYGEIPPLVNVELL